MFLQRKALYNLIQLNLNRIEKGDLKIADLQPWQTENYREKNTNELFQELNQLGINISFEDFEAYRKSFETPEEILETLAKERETLEKDRIFLIIFELWRRLFPEKRSISIFCDELDYQMMAYDMEKPSEIQDALAYLQQLLDDHVDKGMTAEQSFNLIQVFCANDIEDFLFDYILQEIDVGNQSYASDLLDGFKQYMPDQTGFGYLQARVEILQDPEEGYHQLEKLIQKISPEISLDLIEEMIFFLANTGNHSLFYQLAKKTLPLLKVEEDFKEFLEACYAHYDYLELKDQSLAIAQLFYNREHIDSETPLDKSDPGIHEMTSILERKLHFADE